MTPSISHARSSSFILALLRTVPGISIIACIVLYAVAKLHVPANLLITDGTLPNRGWQIHGAQLVQSDAEAPDGSRSALKITSASGDGHLILQSLALPRNEAATFSVYLRADVRTTVYIGISGVGYFSKSARIGQNWQRFSVTAYQQHRGRVNVLVGGMRTFLEGETIHVWGPQLDLASLPTPYQENDARQQSSYDRAIERTRLRFWAGWSLWAAAGFGLLLFFTCKGQPAVRAAIKHLKPLSRNAKQIMTSDRFRIRSAATYALIFLSTLAIMEFVAFTTSWIRALPAHGHEPFTAASAVAARAMALIGADRQLGPQFTDRSTIFSPLSQVRRIPGDLLPPYHINRLGLIDNEGATPILDAMPEKPPGMIRVILYGGSTAMGIGAPTGQQTLTARLEKLLNRHARPGTVFQVLNFGHGGGQTYSDLAFMASMGAYLAPDVSISLNGFNDAFFASESSFVFGGSAYIINWSDFSYHYNNSINGIAPPRPAIISIAPFTSLLFNDIQMALFAARNPANSFFDSTPMRLVTRQFDQDHPGRDRLLLENLRFIGGYFINRDQIFISYLQPHPLQYRTLLHTAPLGPSEAELVNSSIARLARHPPDEYQHRMIAMFDAYGERYRELQREFASNPNIRFLDIRDELRDLSEAAYIDIIHYSVAGQQRLAERMFDDLKSFEQLRSRLID